MSENEELRVPGEGRLSNDWEGLIAGGRVAAGSVASKAPTSERHDTSLLDPSFDRSLEDASRHEASFDCVAGAAAAVAVAAAAAAAAGLELPSGAP